MTQQSWASQLASRTSIPTSPIPKNLEGAVQILCASGETIPNVVGMREFISTSCVIVETEKESSARLRDICRRLGVTVLNVPQNCFILDPFYIEHNVRIGLNLAKFLLQRTGGAKPLLWNYTVGTKPMMIGLERALASIRKERAYDALYVDTREPAPLFLGSQEHPTSLSRPLGVADLLLAQGIYWKSAIVLNTNVAQAKTLGLVPKSPTEWMRRNLRQGYAKFADDNIDSDLLNPDNTVLEFGEWLTCGVARALLAGRRVDEIWIGTRVSHDMAFAPGTDQEIDLLFALRSSLYVCECKMNLKRQERMLPDGTAEVETVKPGDFVLKIAKVASMIGGRLAQPVFICNAKLLREPVELKAKHEHVWAIPFSVADEVVADFDRLILGANQG